MLMEPSQTFDVDGAVVDPNALQHIAGSSGFLAEKMSVVYQVDYIAHCASPLRITG
jgi:hypothetical protein